MKRHLANAIGVLIFAQVLPALFIAATGDRTWFFMVCAQVLAWFAGRALAKWQEQRRWRKALEAQADPWEAVASGIVRRMREDGLPTRSKRP